MNVMADSVPTAGADGGDAEEALVHGRDGGALAGLGQAAAARDPLHTHAYACKHTQTRTYTKQRSKMKKKRMKTTSN